MGCDIHLFAEIKPKKTLLDRIFRKKTKWSCADLVTPNEDYPEYSKMPFDISYKNRFYTGGRNYNLFSALANVRSEHFLQKVEPISYPKGVPKDVSEFVKDKIEEYGSDGHSHSYLSLQELRSYDFSPWGKTCDDFICEVIPKMENLLNKNEDVRIVFFFDN